MSTQTMDETTVRTLLKLGVVAVALGYFGWRRAAAKRPSRGEEEPDPIAREMIQEATAFRDAQPVPELPAELPLPASFDEASRLLARWLGTPAEPMPPATSHGKPATRLVGASFAVRLSAAETIVDRLQPAWAAGRLFVFQSDVGNPFGSQPARIGLLPTDDPLLAVQHRGTCGEATETDEIVAWLRELHTKAPFRLLQAAANTVAGRFHEPPADPRAMAARMFEFATAVCGEGDEDKLDAIAGGIGATREFFLEWE
jgi:hypothetical protein